MNTGANCRQHPGMGRDPHRESYGNGTFYNYQKGREAAEMI
jgi:hypothetical protein